MNDRFGYGTEDLQQMYMSANASLIQRFMPQAPDEKKEAFMKGDLKTKASILNEYSGDTDDALWRSEEWMLLEKMHNG